MNHCPKHENWRVHYNSRLSNTSNDTNTTNASNMSFFDLRVSKALGSKGYNKVRLSVITNGTVPEFDNFNFTY